MTMKRYRFLLVPVMLASATLPASAGIFFKKHPKPNPAERVPALILTLKTDKSDDRREDAAQELRDFEPAAFPEIVPVLIDALEHDAKPGVRIEAAHSLAKFRPVSQEVGMALEEAAAHDAALRVRLQARSLVMQYRLSGYHSPKKGDQVTARPGAQMTEPPLAEPGAASPALVPPGTDTAAQSRKTLRQRLLGPTQTTTGSLTPTDTPVLSPPPSLPRDAGPELSPPR
jgi:hypothetical protein